MSRSSRENTGNTNTAGNSSSGASLTLERKLELLESRFTQPAAGSAERPQHLIITTNAGGQEGNLSRSSNSQQSFSFTGSASNPVVDGSPPGQQSNLPPSAVRSKRRPSLNSSFHAVERATARHLRKVAANSPIQGVSANDNPASAPASLSRNSSNSNASQQTLLTSHVQRIVAESPPVPVTPGVTANNTPNPISKPAAARNILHTQNRNQGGSTATAAKPSNATVTPAAATTGSVSNSKRKSVPKRKHASIKDRSQTTGGGSNSNSSGSSNPIGSTAMTSPDMRKRPRGDDASNRSPRVTNAVTEASRDRSNPPRNTSGNSAANSKRLVAPANNRSIQDFFSTSSNRKQEALAPSNGSSSLPPLATQTQDTNTTASVTESSALNSGSASTSATNAVDWQAKCQKLQQLLQDKDEQLKAVTNNKTILHTALQSALEKTKQELASIKAKAAEKETHMSKVLEDLLRWKSNQQAKDLREKLAADGARLGRIVYTRAGMRALETWEEGYATKDLEQRKQDLASKRKAFEARAETLKDKENSPNGGQMEDMEARESIRMHLENLSVQEAELAKEEQALNDEKGNHIRALKRVASEDSSRFRSRPKLHGRYVLHCLLGKGGFSEVWRGYDLAELREVAVKIHQLDPRWPDSKKENYTKHVSREYEIHRNVRHPRVVSLYDVFEIDNNSFATVLEYCKGTDLDTVLKTKRRLPERQARALLLQILSGMKYLSQPSGSRQGIVHYDLKPGNILFDEYGDAKITDFGLSKIVDAHDPGQSMELTSQGAGTYWYLPPECFITTERVRISNKVDVWSIGVIYYQMLFGSRPFGEGKTQDKLLTDHTMLNAHEVHYPEKPQISDKAKMFIRECLAYDQAFRPSIAQLCENAYILDHEFTDN